MNMTKKEYGEYVKARTPASPLAKNLVRAYVIGGLICSLGSALGSLYTALGMSADSSATLTSMSLIFMSALLTGIGWYDDLARIAGAGTLVPITGFANSVVAPALEFKSEGLITGMAAKMFVISGPVLVFGISSSVVYGLIYALLTT